MQSVARSALAVATLALCGHAAAESPAASADVPVDGAAQTGTVATPASDAAGTVTLEPVVVTAPAMSAPLTVTTDPQAPRQPVPAHDGADYLKTIPGFSMIRKGGTDGDPVFRGMAGSRLNILLDGEQILGGCGMRMDPPTAYVFPESYDRITVLKGPQTVLYGPGNSAGTVLFERDHTRRTEAGLEGRASVTVGSFDRDDEVLALDGGNSDVQARLNATRSHANNYEDGDGVLVHSQYERWSADAALAWMPDDDTWIELSGGQSDGEAAYRDRSMDGTLFARDNIGLRAGRRNISPLVKSVEVNTWRNYIDHVMDNYTLRTFVPTMMMPNPAASNPDRLTLGNRVAVELAPAATLQVTVGADQQSNQHTLRSTMNQPMMPYEAMARVDDAKFRNYGVFGEATQAIGEADRLIGGVRADRWTAWDQRTTTVTAGTSRSESLTSGFLRHEHDIGNDTLYAGIGRSLRFPDYWELIGQGKQSETTNSAFLTRPEQTTQVDMGWLRDAGAVSLSVSGFVADIEDFILIGTVIKAPATVTRNVDAQTYGAEAGAAWTFATNWKADATLAWVRGRNDTDGTPLAQLPPLEMRTGLTWDNGTWSAGGLLRAVDRQDRVAPGTGNIVGQDIGVTPGFAVFSLNGSWRPEKRMLVAAGIDNLFDVAYAEHISRSGTTMISGFEQTTRVNEPGRNAWLKVSVDF